MNLMPIEIKKSNNETFGGNSPLNDVRKPNGETRWGLGQIICEAGEILTDLYPNIKYDKDLSPVVDKTLAYIKQNY
jgi:hypothetical protein